MTRRALAFSLALGLLGGPASAFSLHSQLTTNLGPFTVAHPLSAPTCTPPTAPLDLAIWKVKQADGDPDLSCDNAFVEYLRTPTSASVPVNAFEKIAGQIRAAKSEILIATMDYHSGEGHPGHLLNVALRDLYQQVMAHPEQYPEGITVRIMTGGVPLEAADGGTKSLVNDLRELGVPLSDSPAGSAGWKVSIANYRYFPHNHVKMVVIDGNDVSMAGYSIADWHQTTDLPGGHNLKDLALRMHGPIAQEGVAAFNDLWSHTKQLFCPANIAPASVDKASIEKGCVLGDPIIPSRPLAAQAAQPAQAGANAANSDGLARAFLLYRRPGYEEADRAHVALFGAAQQSLDIMHADFSPGPACTFAFMSPDGCEEAAMPVYLRAITEAMRRGVKVRVICVDYGAGTMPNRAGIALLRYQARLMGHPERFDARYVDGTMHTKAMTVDVGAPTGSMVVAGSMNFHFSAWGQLGLAEGAIASSDPQAIAEQQADFERVWNTDSRPVPLEGWLKGITPTTPSK